MNGWLAHKAGRQNNENPYNGHGLQSFSRSQWLDGWCARFAAVKHGLDLSLDDDGEI